MKSYEIVNPAICVVSSEFQYIHVWQKSNVFAKKHKLWY